VTGHPADPDRASEDAADRADWIRDLDAALSAAGLATRLKETAGCLDVTTTIHSPGHKPTDVVVDEDGYIELHWWRPPDATPQQVAGIIARALNALGAVDQGTGP
jgi:hypothetical protein